MTDPTIGLILVGAGSSRRMGGINKIWAELDHHPLVWHSLTRFVPVVAAAVLVVEQSRLELAREFCVEFPQLAVTAGGEERQHSVLAGLESLPPCDAVAVHDVARPLAPLRLLLEGLALLAQVEGAVPAITVADTLKRVDDHAHVMSTVDRSQVRAVQTPQVFRAGTLLAAHAAAARNGTRATDDASLLELAGYSVGTFPGVPYNFKITTDYDLALARAIHDSDLLS